MREPKAGRDALFQSGSGGRGTGPYELERLNEPPLLNLEAPAGLEPARAELQSAGLPFSHGAP